MNRYRFAARPGWLALHVFTVAIVVTMVLLGRWQLDVSNSKHFSLQNFGYAIQWWLFSACAILFWGRLLRDQARTAAHPGEPGEPAEHEQQPEPPVAYRRYVMPTVQNEPTDSVHSAYNDYLASLAARDAEQAGGGPVNSEVLGYQQPSLPAKSVDAAATALLRYRVMAFVTGVVLLSGCVTLILKYGTSLDMEPLTGYVWVAHGWLYLIYVVMTAILGFKLRWPLARYALVMLAGTIPTASFVAEHFVTRQTRAAAQPEPVRD